MKKEQIEQIRKDIDAYKTAIEDAEGALQAAERELDDALKEMYHDEMPQEDPFQVEPVYIAGKNGDCPGEMLIEVFVNHIQVLSRKVILSDDFPPF